MKDKKETGITLIALVVTIVVLIILATVSINAVLGQNGIIKKAKQAKEMYQEAKTNEEIELNSLFSEMEKFFDENKDSVEGTLLVLEENEDSIKVKMTRDGAEKYQFSLDGTNWSPEQGEDEYTFKNLAKTMVNNENYQEITGTEYKVYSKVIDSDGEEFVYGPIYAKTSVIVEGDSKYLEYEEENGEITIGAPKNVHSGLSIGAVSRKVPCIHPYYRITEDASIKYGSKAFGDCTISKFAMDQCIKASAALASTAFDLIEKNYLLSEVKEEFYNVFK